MPKLLSSIKRFIGTSDEAKATDCPNGSTFFETDTGNMYVFKKGNLGGTGAWSLKDEADMSLRLEMKFLLTELLTESRKTNGQLELIADSLSSE